MSDQEKSVCRRIQLDHNALKLNLNTVLKLSIFVFVRARLQESSSVSFCKTEGRRLFEDIQKTILTSVRSPRTISSL